jgi:hypothetical protein
MYAPIFLAMRNKRFLRYVLVYPFLFVAYSLLLNGLKLTTGSVLLDVAALARAIIRADMNG